VRNCIFVGQGATVLVSDSKAGLVVVVGQQEDLDGGLFGGE
jgi:hypothetical protein